MNPPSPNLEAFVEKIVRHNRLVSESNLTKAKAYCQKKPDLGLLEVLVKAKLVSEKHSQLILEKYKQISEQHVEEPEPTPEPAPEPAPPAKRKWTGTPAAPPIIPGAPSPEVPFPGTYVDYQSDMSSSSEPQPDGDNISRVLIQEEDESHSSPTDITATDKENEKSLGEEKQIDSEVNITEENITQEVSSPVDPGTSSKQANATLEDYLAMARRKGATDLHINVGSPPMIRKFGNMISLQGPPLTSTETESLLFQILSEDDRKKLVQESVLDACMKLGDGRYRCCFVKQRAGWDGSFRIISDEIPTFDGLGLPDELIRLTEFREGLVLITGPSGSGKSTTLAAFVDLINRTRNEHIITLEEPVEYIFTSDQSQISQREVGLHTSSFSAALRAALREDPDIIVVGELRDRETTSLAISAAETGHLVFATLHTTSAAQTIYRLLDFFPPGQRNQIRAMVSESMRGIICQRLIPKSDGDGMALAQEIMFNVTSIANLIREDRVFQIPNMIQINNMNGMRLLDESIAELLQQEVITPEEAYFAADNKEKFRSGGPQIESANIEEVING